MDKLFCIFIGLSSLMLATAQMNAGALNTSVTNSACGTTRACFTDPAGCDPATSSSCLFVSTQSNGGSGNLNFEMRGESSGYIAVVLSADTTAGGNDTTYICANNNNNSVNFFLALLVDNSTLSIQTISGVANVTGSFSNNTIQCVFDVSGLNATASRNADSTFSIALGSGSLVNGQPSSPSLRTIISSVNLANPNSTNTATTTAAPNTTNTNATTANANSTTTTTTTTAASGANISLQHGFSQALLIILGVVAMSVL